MKSRTLSVDNEDERSDVDEDWKDAHPAGGAHAHPAGRAYVAGHAHPAGCAHTAGRAHPAGCAHPTRCAYVAGRAHPAGRAHAGDAFFANDAHQSGDVNFAVGADPGADAADLATGDLAHPVFIADSLGRSTPRQVEQITLQKDDRVP